jgi:hypothetical protein
VVAEEEVDNMAVQTAQGKNVANNLQISRKEDRQDQYNRLQLDRSTDLVGVLGVFYTNKEIVQEPRSSNNIMFLGTGDFKGKVFEKDFTIVKGINQSTFTEPVEIKDNLHIIFDGVSFVEANSKSANYLVKIGKGCKVIFQNCQFIRQDKSKIAVNTTGASFILLTSTIAEDVATFSGCMFIQTADSGASNIVGRQAGFGNAYVYNSINATTPAVAYGAAVVGTGGNI